jgi:type IV pilus assembly protein PilM
MIPLLEKLKAKFAKDIISVGLDIGNSSIKLVKLKFTQDTVELCAYDLEPAQVNLDVVLKKLAQTHNINSVTTSVSGPSSIIRYVNFPQMELDELKQSLKFEAQKYIPFSITDVNFDSSILKTGLPDKKMAVMLAAVKKEFITQRLKIMEKSGLSPAKINIDSIAIMNAFNFNYPQDTATEHKTVALLNIGAAQTNLNILEGALPRLSRDINIAGNTFTQKLAEIFGVDFKAAEKLKLNPDKESADKIKFALESVLANLATEIRVSFDYYESQSSSSVVKIYLGGGASLGDGFKEKLAGMLDIGVEYWDPLKKITIPENIDSQKVKALSAQLTVAAGLALHR